jgi:hypothetical protein
MRSPLAKFRALPLRTRWLTTIAAYALVIAVIVIAIHESGGGHEGASSAQAEATAVAEANHEGRLAIAQDESPHDAKLARGLPPQVALERAIGADVRSRITHGELTGPLQSVDCQPPAQPHAERRQLSCTVRSAGISYPFIGVADERALELTWCKVDPPPVANEPLEVPVSARCRA